MAVKVLKVKLPLMELIFVLPYSSKYRLVDQEVKVKINHKRTYIHSVLHNTATRSRDLWPLVPWTLEALNRPPQYKSRSDNKYCPCVCCTF